jgi:hypothetical protein
MVQKLHTINRLLESCASAQEPYPIGSSTLAITSGIVFVLGQSIIKRVRLKLTDGLSRRRMAGI